MVAPPGPAVQKLNSVLHRDPFSSITYAVFWSLVLLVGAPLAIVVLQLQLIVRLLLWVTGQTGKSHYSPRTHSKLEMAVVVTGCDTGFGTEIAFWAAQAGFHVFAGCLLKESFGQFENCTAIKPIQMNVCNDNDVQEVVKQVVTWLDGGGEKKKQRVLHALINNAGIGDGGLIDWLDISVFQRNMDGTQAKHMAFANYSKETASRACSTPLHSQLLWYDSDLQSFLVHIQAASN